MNKFDELKELVKKASNDRWMTDDAGKPYPVPSEAWCNLRRAFANSSEDIIKLIEAAEEVKSEGHTDDCIYEQIETNQIPECSCYFEQFARSLKPFTEKE
jgi:hypothetical protein